MTMLAQNNYNKKDIELLKEQITFDLNSEIGAAVSSLKTEVVNEIKNYISSQITGAKNEILSMTADEIVTKVTPTINSAVNNKVLLEKDKLSFGTLDIGNADVYRHSSRMYAADGTESPFSSDTSIVLLKNLGIISIPANGTAMITMQTAGLREVKNGMYYTDYAITNVMNGVSESYDSKYESLFNFSIADETTMLTLYIKNRSNTIKTIAPNKLVFKGFFIKYGQPQFPIPYFRNNDHSIPQT